MPRYPKIGFLAKVEMMWLTMPKAGRIMMYTSGWPKNQKRCRHRVGSPPPSGLKNEVPKLRSVSSMVMAPARTGRASSSRNAVTRIDHANSGMRWSVMPGARMLKIVVMKLMAPRIDEAPAMCSEKIARSIPAP